MMDKIVQSMIDEKLNNLHTALICKITKVDLVKMKASIKPLNKKKFKEKDPVDLPLIENVPISIITAGDFYIRPPYQVGDLVIAVFSERRIDEIMNFAKDTGRGQRKHSLDDAIIVGGINPFSNNLKTDNLNDLVISNKDDNSHVMLQQNGDIRIKGNNIFLDGNVQNV